MTRPMYGAVYTGEDYVAPPMTDDEKRMARLPRWARMHIETLERDLASAKRQSEEIGGERETDTRMLRSYPEEPIGLPAGSRIEYGTDRRIEVRWQDGALQIMTSGGGMRIEPKVSNVILIHPEDRFQ